MLQPEAETGDSGAGVASSSAATNGAHNQEGGAGGVVAVGADIEDGKSRGGRSEELGIGGSGGNRWPRQETLALLQIRSDMEGVFRDSTHKSPLWEDVSRKMAELGYRRSAKKCREKFENVYKYHKRTKDGRAGKGDGRTYRFFDQLQAMESTTNQSFTVESAVPIAMVMPPPRPSTPLTQSPFTVTSTPPNLIQPVTTPVVHHHVSAAAPVHLTSFSSNTPSGTPSSSSSTSSDEEITGMKRSRKKRKWNDFFEKLTKDVMAKQEELHRKFLEAIERRENDRKVRDEAWKVQETARLKREHESLVHERSTASARDAALISFLQKLSDHHQIPLPPSILLKSQPPPPPPPPETPIPVPVLPIISQPQQITNVVDVNPAPKRDSGSSDRSASRWPKVEIEELIKIRTAMEEKYQEGVPKGPLWEEISAEMKSRGYNRNAKRCKEKWENINKYFRKVKDSNKKPRLDSKTCPYYHHLEALYATKSPAAIMAGEGYEIVARSSADASSVGGATEDI